MKICKKSNENQYNYVDDEIDNIEQLIFNVINEEELNIIEKDYRGNLYKITISDYYSDRCRKKVVKLDKLLNIQRKLDKYNLKLTWLSTNGTFNLIMLIITYKMPHYNN